jgi:hypothetical protein
MMRYILPVVIFAAITAACHPSRIAEQKIQPEADQIAVVMHEADQVTAVEPPVQPEVNYYSPETWLMGYFLPDMMRRPPHGVWYAKEYDRYEPDETLIQKITSTNVSGVSVLIVLGTWCGDSRREVPRFIKIIDQCGLAKISITYLGVDMNKIGPVGDYDKLGIVKVPTFIVYRNNIEAGRIIEYPSSSLEGDLLEILLKETK